MSFLSVVSKLRFASVDANHEAKRPNTKTKKGKRNFYFMLSFYSPPPQIGGRRKYQLPVVSAKGLRLHIKKANEYTKAAFVQCSLRLPFSTFH